MFKCLWVSWSVLIVFLLGMDSPLSAQPPLSQPAQVAPPRPALATAEGTEQIAKTLSDWTARHKRFQSARYVVSGEVEQKNLPANSKLPSKRPAKYVVLLDLARGRVRVETNDSGPDLNFEKYVPRASVCAYDGTTLQQNVDREVCELGPTNPDVCLTRGPMNTVQFDNSIWPVLFAHGVVPTVNKPARPDRLPAQHTAEEFEFRGQVRHMGKAHIVLRTDPVASVPSLVDEFWIDPAKDSAIARHTYFSGKNPWLRFDITYQKSEHGWLPGSWIFAHSIGSELIVVTHFTIEQLEVNPAVTDADFTLPIAPGAIVATKEFPVPGKGLDPFKPADGLFRVESDGTWTNLKESGFTTAEGVPLPPATRNTYWVWIVAALLGIALMATATFLYWRRMRRLTRS